MTLLALGINHKTAPVSLRERVTFSPDTLDQALDSLLAQPMVQGGVVLSTCNRTELYLSVEEQDNLQEALVRWLCEYHNLNEEDLRNSLYWHQDNDAVSHLMRVASGLDSLVLGEPQILGQVKKAFADSQKGHLNASALERMFQKSFSVAKRVRTETDIGASAVSVAFAACTLARQIFESLSTVTVLLVGAGETIELVARHLREHKVKKMIIANRTRERAQVLADEVGAEVISLSDIDARLQDADIIISSTASPLPIIGKGMVERALKNRRNQPMLLVDIAVPRDVEPEVGKLSNAYLYSVDDLQSIISHNLAQRKAAAVEAETIVEQEASEFMAWLRAQGASDTIREYRSQSEQIRDELTAKALAALQQGGDAQAIMQDLAWKLTNRLIHAPTKSLQQAARDGHLMRVASGLDSLVLGEPQILGQVKKAFADSQKGHLNASALERMFQKSFSVAKRVRTETDIGASAVSVAFAACTLARQIFESLSTVTVLLVGAGETIELVARHLREHKVKKMIIANRTRERAQVLADEVGAEVISLSDIDARLQDADIIISSTASPLPIIGKGMVERALKNRRNQPMLLVDIAVPRDVEPEVGKLSNAYLYSVDDLQSIISHNLAQRKAAAVEAETIVEQEASEFMAWLRAQGASDTIREYRSQSEQIRDELTAKALAALQQGGDAQAIMQDLAWKLTNRLIHAPTKSLQQAARDGDSERLNILRDSLGLE